MLLSSLGRLLCKSKKIIKIAATSAMVALLLTACSLPDLIPQPSLPLSTHQVLIYPGASDVKRTSKSTPIFPWEDVSFRTTDTSDVVLDFYRNTLNKEGWVSDRNGTNSSTSLSLDWPITAKSSVVYWIHITAEPDGEGSTIVKIALHSDGGG